MLHFSEKDNISKAEASFRDFQKKALWRLILTDIDRYTFIMKEYHFVFLCVGSFIVTWLCLNQFALCRGSAERLWRPARLAFPVPLPWNVSRKSADSGEWKSWLFYTYFWWMQQVSNFFVNIPGYSAESVGNLRLLFLISHPLSVIFSYSPRFVHVIYSYPKLSSIVDVRRKKTLKICLRLNNLSLLNDCGVTYIIVKQHYKHWTNKKIGPRGWIDWLKWDQEVEWTGWLKWDQEVE